MVAANQTRIHRGHRGARARAVARAGKNRPALRDGVDLTLGIVDRTERRAVIEVGAAIPLAIPRIVLNPLVQLHRLQLAAVRERRVVPHTRDFGEFREDVAKKESKPNAFTLAVSSDEIHAIVPVA